MQRDLGLEVEKGQVRVCFVEIANQSIIEHGPKIFWTKQHWSVAVTAQIMLALV